MGQLAATSRSLFLQQKLNALGQKRRGITVNWCNLYPQDACLPNCLVPPTYVYGDVNPISDDEKRDRNQLIMRRLFFHRFLDLGCGHQNPGNCRHGCEKLFKMVLDTYSSSLAESKDQNIAMKDAMKEFFEFYDKDHFYSWAKTIPFCGSRHIIHIFEEVIRSDAVATCIREHERKTREMKDILTEKMIRGKAGKPEDKDGVYANIVSTQDEGILRQRAVPLQTEFNRITTPVSEMNMIQGTGTCMETYIEPIWMTSYFSLLQYQYPVEWTYSLKDGEKCIYATITKSRMTDYEVHQDYKQKDAELSELAKDMKAEKKHWKKFGRGRARSTYSGVFSVNDTSVVADPEDVIMAEEEEDQKPAAINTSIDTEQTTLNSSLDTTDDNEEEWNDDAPLPIGSVNGYRWKVGHN